VFAPGKADLAFVRVYGIAPLGKQEMILPLLAEKRYQHS
jgi:hypothetical protein